MESKWVTGETLPEADGNQLNPKDSRANFLLPYKRNPFFTGRDSELSDLADHVLPAPVNSHHPQKPGKAVICGQSGSGKTELVVEFCHRWHHLFQHIFWLHAEYDIASQIAVYGRMMGLPIEDLLLEKQVDYTIDTWSAGSPLLVIFDYADDNDVIREWLKKFDSMHIIITSRTENIWKDEFGWHTVQLERFSSSNSRRLLFQLAPHLECLDEQWLQEILDRLDGLPQAINLAGRCMAGEKGIKPREYIIEMNSADIVLSRASQDSRPEDTPHQIPILALTYVVTWKHLRKQTGDDLSWKVFHACGYCAANIPITWKILTECFSVDRKQKNEQLRQTIKNLDRLGLIIDTGKEPVILHQLAEFSRWIENESNEGSILPKLSDSLTALTRHINEQKQSGLLDSMQEHIREVAIASEDAGLLKSSGALWNSLGYHFWVMKNFENAKTCLEQSLRLTEMVYGKDHANIAAVVNNLGDVFLAQGNLHSARTCFENAIRIWDKTLGTDHLNIAKAATNLARVLKKQGDLIGAQTNLERTLVIMSKEFGAEHARVASIFIELGSILMELGEMQEAQTCFERVLKIDEKSQSTPDMDLSRHLEKIAQLLTEKGEHHKAQLFYQRVFHIREQLLEPDDDEFEISIQALLDNYSMQAIIEKPESTIISDHTLLENLHLIYKTMYGDFSFDTANHMQNLGKKFYNNQQILQAQTCFESALYIYYALPDLDPLIIADSSNQLAKVYLSSGKLQSAEEHALRALSVYESQKTTHNSGLIDIFNTLGEIYNSQKKHEKAKIFFTRSIEAADNITDMDDYD